jgi:hypothetical protein
MNDATWYYVLNGQQQGPVSQQTISEQIREGKLDSATLVWTDGLDGWKKASEVEGLIPRPPAIVAVPVGAMAPTANPRPPSVTVFGIIAIVFGAFGLICSPFSVLIYSLPIPEMPKLGGFFKQWVLFSAVLGTAAGMFKIAFGIGLLRLRSWARKAAVWYGFYAIVMQLVGLGVGIKFAGMGGKGRPEDVMIGIISAVVGAILGLAYEPQAGQGILREVGAYPRLPPPSVSSQFSSALRRAMFLRDISVRTASTDTVA